jgi:hypothetical protein
MERAREIERERARYRMGGEERFRFNNDGL